MQIPANRLSVFAYPVFYFLLTTTPFLLGQKFEGLASTPPMGWNSWNTFEVDISDELVREVAQAMIDNGMRDAGYNYIVLDDGWMAMERDAEGNLVPHPDKFPHGLTALSQYLHENGFKFGLYNCAGEKTCAGYPGSQGHEFQDARLYASMGVDYLKYDWCNSGSRDAEEAYTTMSRALRAAGRPVVFSLCEWGQNDPWEWAEEIGHLWRTTGDIIDCWDCVERWSQGIKIILDRQMDLVEGHNGLELYAGPGHWNDPDMLEVGNPGLTLPESRAHFTLWCILAAPLIAGNDVREMKQEISDILTNPEAIAINQDPLGRQGSRFFKSPEKEIWLRPLSGGDWAVCVLNASDEKKVTSVEWDHIGQVTGLTNFRIRDVWTGETLGMTRDSKGLSRELPPHDVIFLRLVSTAGAPAPRPAGQLIDSQAGEETVNLYKNLQHIAKEHVLFGHQNTLAYGYAWKAEEHRSDVHEVTGSFPAVYGWDLEDLLKEHEEDSPYNITRENLKRWIQESYGRGGVTTFSWHQTNPVTGGSFYDKTPAVSTILPGGIHHEKYRRRLDTIADFFKDLDPIPVIFRPYHEHNGDWFWWGKPFVPEKEFVELWRFTVDYLRSEKHVHNVIYAFSPDRSRMDPDAPDASYFYGYPGDDYVDIFGLDNYWDVGHEANPLSTTESASNFRRSLERVVELAGKHGKLPALTETGMDTIPEPNWWTDVLLAGLNANETTRGVGYVLVWRNANKSVENREHFFAPYPGHPSAHNFRTFKDSPLILFEDELPNLYK